MPGRPLTWLITGTSSGFGLSLARFAQASGHKVIASSRNPHKTPELKAEIESKGGKWIKLDVTDLASAKVVDDLEAGGDHIDVLVNNAGFAIFSPIETTTEKEACEQMDAMYFGPVRLIRGVLPYMRKRRFGVIVNISSGASLEGAPAMGIYAGAKGGLDATTRVLTKEVASFNIRTLSVVLGTFNTSFNVAPMCGETPVPDDYNGTSTGNMLMYLKAGKVPINGDKDKAMKTLYDLVTATGVGAGKENEHLLLLGPDMVARAKLARDHFGHALDVFEEVANSCGANA